MKIIHVHFVFQLHDKILFITNYNKYKLYIVNNCNKLSNNKYNVKILL